MIDNQSDEDDEGLQEDQGVVFLDFSLLNRYLMFNSN
jgi:hypothetical protein